MKTFYVLMLAAMLAACGGQENKPAAGESQTDNRAQQYQNQQKQIAARLADEEYFIGENNLEQIRLHANLKERAQKLLSLLAQADKESRVWVLPGDAAKIKEFNAAFAAVAKSAEESFGGPFLADKAGLYQCTAAANAAYDYFFARQRKDALTENYRKQYTDNIAACQGQIRIPPTAQATVYARKGIKLPLNNCSLIKTKKGELTMKDNLIKDVVQKMLPYLNNAQTQKLQEILQYTLVNYEVTKTQDKIKESEQNFIELFLSAKRIEGCSEKSLKYYQSTIETMVNNLQKEVKYIVTDDIRRYLTEYQQKNNSSKVTIDNIRRILSSFFSWLEDEDYILKSPVRRIHKVKTGINIKETYSDEMLELMRDNCSKIRDLAIIDMLASTGMRIGEMVLLNRNDIDFIERECVVFGKGSKERIVYFDARTKIHLQNYLESRIDDNPALFVSLKLPHKRLQIGGIETRLREFGKKLGLSKVHPHKFRRTLATMAIDKGMPIEQLQQLLGHRKIDTTLQYAMVKQSNVKIAHRKYIG